MTRALLICGHLVCGALAVQTQIRGGDMRGGDSCGQYDEVLKNYDGYVLGSSLHLPNGAAQKVSWETASARILTPPYSQKSSEFLRDTEEPSGTIGHPYGLETESTLENGFETVDVAGCSAQNAQIGEMQSGKLLGGATIVGGLRPIPGNPSHALLGGRAPRVSFCFPRNDSMDGRLTWGASDQRADGTHTTLAIAGGMKGHHWAVNVTGMSMRGIDASGHEWSEEVLEKQRQAAAEDKAAYWIAVFSTGSPTITAPKELLSEIERHLNEKNLVDCAKTSSLPTLKFELDHQVYTLPPEAYLARPKDAAHQRALQELPLHFRPKIAAEETIPEGSCVMMFAPPTPFQGVFVLGQPFLRYYATTYDYEQRKIITAPHDGPCWSGTSRSTLTYFVYVVTMVMLFSSML